MGLLDFLRGKTECPHCGAKGARKSGEEIRCPNLHCIYFDPNLGGWEAVSEAATSQAAQGNFAPTRPITVRYLNHQGQQKTFTADAESAVRKRNHISLRVTPSGIRMALSRDRIQNLKEVEGAFPQRVRPGQEWPTPRERQVLSYHKKRKTTSALHDRIRGKYPDW